MNDLQLTNSTVVCSGNTTCTLFIACQNGCYGAVAAGTWKTVLPFCYDRIEILEGGLAAFRRGRRTLYRILADSDGCRLLPARQELACRNRR